MPRRLASEHPETPSHATDEVEAHAASNWNRVLSAYRDEATEEEFENDMRLLKKIAMKVREGRMAVDQKTGEGRWRRIRQAGGDREHR